VISGWNAETPAGFAFALKAPRRITHDACLKDVVEPLRYFLDTARTLGPKLGPVLFQLPPSFKKDVDRLGDVLALLPTGVRSAFEFRHQSWFGSDVYALLMSGNAALCVADTEEGTTPVVPTADFGYLRLRDKGYTTEDLKKWAKTVNGFGTEWQDTFIYFKHEESGIGPVFAQEFRVLLTA
jgi:uncharacterized protein YecE (DUF72 family)